MKQNQSYFSQVAVLVEQILDSINFDFKNIFIDVLLKKCILTKELKYLFIQLMFTSIVSILPILM